MKPPSVYGLLVEFAEPEALVEAVKKVRAAGYRKIDAFTPFPIEEVEEALELPRTRLPWFVLAGGILGGLGGFGLQYWVAVIAYPLNVGGRPLNSWPSFVPVTFESTILLAAFTGLVTMLALNKLPMPYHPVFNVEQFARASRDRFFLCIEAADPRFDPERTQRWLQETISREVFVVPN